MASAVTCTLAPVTIVLAPLAAALSTTAAMGLDVRETADCPSAEALRCRYVALAPPATSGGGIGASGQARVIVRNGLLDVSLRNGSGALVGQREVTAPGRCDDRAIAESGLYGRSACRARTGDRAGAEYDARAYLERFLDGPRAARLRERAGL